MRGIAHWDMKFIRGNHTELRIAVFPPELMSDDRNIHRISWLGNCLGAQDYPRRAQEQHHHDQDGNHGPRQLDLVAAVNLRRLALLIARTMTIANQCIQKHARNDKEDGCGDA